MTETIRVSEWRCAWQGQAGSHSVAGCDSPSLRLQEFKVRTTDPDVESPARGDFHKFPGEQNSVEGWPQQDVLGGGVESLSFSFLMDLTVQLQ